MAENYWQSQQFELFNSLAQDLRLPFLQVQSKLHNIALNQANISSMDVSQLELSTNSGLRLLEAYILSSSNQPELQLEPYTVGILLDDIAHQLFSYAKVYGSELVVDNTSKHQTVLIDKNAANLSLYCLAESMIRAQSAASGSDKVQKNKIILGAHSHQNKVLAGIYANLEGLTNQAVSKARQLTGKAQQPFTSLSAHSSGGIIIADRLCSLFSGPLRYSVHNGSKGLATIFQVSNQLRLVD